MASTRLAKALSVQLTRAMSELGTSTSTSLPALALARAAAPPAARRWDANAAAAAAAGAPGAAMVPPLDTLDMMCKFERLGMTRQQAEALTHTLTDVLCANRDQLAQSYVSVISLDKTTLEQEARQAGFRSEVLKSQELQVAQFMRDTERLQSNLEKVRSEIRYEVDKLTASQRLDLNLEKGRMRDELQALRDKSNEMEIKVDKEVNSLKAAMEQSKNDTVKYVLGLMLALMTAGLGAARLVMH